MEKGLRGSSWSTGAISLQTKDDTPIAEGDNWDVTGTPGEVAPFVPIDQRPGYVPVLYQSLTIADLLGSAQTNSNSVRYVQETTNFSSDNAAASVAEGAAKPESNLSFDQADTPVQKIATFIPITDEALMDAGQIRQVINDRLSLFVRMEEENQLLNGTGAGSDLVGILDQVPGANDGVVSDADTPNAADHIYAAITAVRDSFLEADGIVIHPDDWADLRLLKDDNLNYIGGLALLQHRIEPRRVAVGQDGRRHDRPERRDRPRRRVPYRRDDLPQRWSDSGCLQQPLGLLR